MNEEPYWEISGPRKYLNIPSPVPDKWRAEMRFGGYPNYDVVVGWGPTMLQACEDAERRAREIKQKG